MTHSDGRSLCFTDAHPAATSGQLREHCPVNRQLTAGQISASKSRKTGTPSERGEADRGSPDGTDSEAGALQRGGDVSLQNSQIVQSSRLTTGAIVQQGLELRSISHSKPYSISEKGHVKQSASPSPILQSNFIRKPHLVAIPQTSLEEIRTRCLQDTESITSSGPSRQRELGVKFGSANAHVDPPREESTHGPNAKAIDHTAHVQLSGGISSPPWSTSCVFCSSSSSPLGPSLVRKTASHNMHAPRDVGKVTHYKQSHSKSTVVPEKVPLRLDYTVPTADPLP
jgi:hypothetical protein